MKFFKLIVFLICILTLTCLCFYLIFITVKREFDVNNSADYAKYKICANGNCQYTDSYLNLNSSTLSYMPTDIWGNQWGSITTVHGAYSVTNFPF
jgi:hypothetical protein